jgi:hypothetical protein
MRRGLSFHIAMIAIHRSMSTWHTHIHTSMTATTTHAAMATTG